MPLELIAPTDNRGARILTSKVKSTDTESFLGVTDEVISDKITTLAIDVFHALGARDYGRIDIRLDKFGTPYFLEANLVPSLIDGYGNFPKACLLNRGMDYETMMLRIVALGMLRTQPKLEEVVGLSPVFVPAYSKL
jgi:D-alanine-D-alanine ligase